MSCCRVFFKAFRNCRIDFGLCDKISNSLTLASRCVKDMRSSNCEDVMTFSSNKNVRRDFEFRFVTIDSKFSAMTNSKNTCKLRQIHESYVWRTTVSALLLRSPTSWHGLGMSLWLGQGEDRLSSGRWEAPNCITPRSGRRQVVFQSLRMSR